jgi:hypothetical protein
VDTVAVEKPFTFALKSFSCHQDKAGSTFASKSFPRQQGRLDVRSPPRAFYVNTERLVARSRKRAVGAIVKTFRANVKAPAGLITVFGRLVHFVELSSTLFEFESTA